ncbi:hypothetical protein GQ55_6G124500 [Panicum hallii var. hallii]|uniref:FAR1 domain-containing protein n=1 Tax=Panicum hallii var. hallii TaxID=1504633 RepID=A0A2T7D5Z4_9POAL|nr:hypothetical protein GQ55_6G124500 [Panicum hallii var. hallii]
MPCVLVWISMKSLLGFFLLIKQWSKRKHNKLIIMQKLTTFSYYTLCLLCLSWEVGFGIKKATRVTNKKGFHTMRDMRCLCSGSEERSEYKTKKTGCKAMIQLLRSNNDGWYIPHSCTQLLRLLLYY